MFTAKSIWSVVAVCVLLFVGVVTASAQVITVSGVVTDEAGEAVIGATIQEKATSKGTITDFDGKYRIDVDADAVLVFSYVGYSAQEIGVGGRTVINVVMREDSQLLDEVVAIGYGVVKKNDATGSITAINPDPTNKGLNTNMQEMLQGKVAGVNVTTDGGSPGGGATIRIRGGSSLNASNDPLIVIDGLAMDNTGIQGVSNPLSMVNPNDIETFTVLKDASATAIYGSRASNGVIIITTKKGTAGQKPQVTYDGNFSTGFLADRLSVLDGNEYREYINALDAQGVMSDDAMAHLGTANTDWQAAIYRPALSTDHNISVAGGAKNMPYRVSLGYTLQNGIIKTSQMQRVTASVNLSPTFLDKHLTFNINAKGMYIGNRFADGGVVGAALSMDPTKPIYDDSTAAFGGFYQDQRPGTYNDSDPTWAVGKNAQSTQNPVAALEQKNDRSQAGSFIGNIEGDYKIHGFEDLRIHANFGADYSYGEQHTVISPYSYSNHYYGWDGMTQKTKYNMSFNIYAQYYKDFTDNHHFDAMVGYEWQYFKNYGMSYGSGFYRETNMDPELAGKPYNYSDNEWASHNALMSYFGRVNYVAMNRYMVTATVRGDGSSRFAPGKKWGLFPSVALGWKISEEGFLQGNNTVSDLKLRLGWGVTGQQNIGYDFAYLPVYVESQEGAYYTFGEVGADGKYIYYNSLRPNEFNPDLTWEKTTTYNAGIDFGFLNNRITGSVDYYFRETTDLINVVDVPCGTNMKNRVISNVGSLTNQGVEVMLNAVAINTKALKWDIGFNATWNENRITDLYGGDDDYYISTGGIGDNKTIQAHKVGYAAGSFYVYETYQDENGKYQIVDHTGEGEITSADKVLKHSAMPDFTFGLTSKWEFYNFDISFSLRANVGNYVYNSVLASNTRWIPYNMVYQNQSGFHSIMHNAYDLYWETGFHREDYAEGELTDMYLENASFLRCDNITIGYTFTKPKINARIFATVQNPFVITGYSGLDPEVNGGIDNNIYPRSLTGIVGVSLKF